MKSPFYKSKTQTAEYTASMLPHNRREVFFDVVKLQWTSFMGYGMMVLLFSAPMLLFTWIEDSHSYGIMQKLESLTVAEREEAYRELLSMSNTKALLNIFSFLILSVCISGLIRIIRQHAWEENVSFFSEFITGIKQNIGQMLLLGLISGSVNALAVFSYNYSVIAQNKILSVLLIIPIGLAVFFFIPVAAYTVVCISIYNNNLYGNLKIGLLVFLKTPLKTFLALICSFIPFAPQLIPNTYFHIFGGMIGAILAPFVILGWFLFASDQLDEYVNKQHFPLLVGRGTVALDDMKKQDFVN